MRRPDYLSAANHDCAAPQDHPDNTTGQYLNVAYAMLLITKHDLALYIHQMSLQEIEMSAARHSGLPICVGFTDFSRCVETHNRTVIAIN